MYIEAIIFLALYTYVATLTCEQKELLKCISYTKTTPKIRNNIHRVLKLNFCTKCTVRLLTRFL